MVLGRTVADSAIVEDTTTTDPCDVTEETCTYVVVLVDCAEVATVLATELAEEATALSELADEAPVERLTCLLSSLANA